MKPVELERMVKKSGWFLMNMKKLNVVIEHGEDGFFAFIQEVDGCTACGNFFRGKKENSKNDTSRYKRG